MICRIHFTTITALFRHKKNFKIISKQAPINLTVKDIGSDLLFNHQGGFQLAMLKRVAFFNDQQFP